MLTTLLGALACWRRFREATLSVRDVLEEVCHTCFEAVTDSFGVDAGAMMEVRLSASDRGARALHLFCSVRPLLVSTIWTPPTFGHLRLHRHPVYGRPEAVAVGG